MYNLIRKAVMVLFVALLVGGGLSACGIGGDKSGQHKESGNNQKAYNKMVDQDPAHQMVYSPTRKTINFWIDTWNKPGQLAYVYLMNNTGTLIGYFVFKGPPVSMCTALTPTYKIYKSSNGNVLTPAPAADGVYYSGGECNTYYGQDAQTGAYVEFSVGQALAMLLYSQPLSNHPNVPKLGN
jgi:hypothetical protein